jgi:hypothetical protein
VNHRWTQTDEGQEDGRGGASLPAAGAFIRGFSLRLRHRAPALGRGFRLQCPDFSCPLPPIVAPLRGARYFLGARPRVRRPWALLLDAFGVLRERHAVANNARPGQLSGRGEPLMLALIPVPIARGSVAVARRGAPRGFAKKQRSALAPRGGAAPLHPHPSPSSHAIDAGASPVLIDTGLQPC